MIVGASAEAIVDGDCKVAAISAASILAKVYRDEVMRRLHALYPEYGFAEHKGYATAAHLAALARLGPVARAPRELRAGTRQHAADTVRGRGRSLGAGARACVMSTAAFVHLSVHTEYSLVDSVVRVPALVEAVAATGMPAVALTDQCNLFAMVKFYSAAQRRGLKPIIGADLRVRDAEEPARDARDCCCARIAAGYRNLSRLLTRAQLEGQRAGAPLLERDWLVGRDRRPDRIVRRAGRRRRPRADRRARGSRRRWRWTRGSTCSAIATIWNCSAPGGPTKTHYANAAVALAARRGMPVVATNDVRFLRPGDYDAHEARVCIQEGSCWPIAAARAATPRSNICAVAGRDGGAVRRPAERSPTAWRSRVAAT